MHELSNLDWFKIVEKMQTYATSEMARELLQKTTTLENDQAAQQSFNQILEMQQVIKAGHRGHMQSLDLFSLWQQRLAKDAVLKTLELKDVRHFCLEVIALKEILRPHPSPWLKSICDALMEAQEPLSAIDQLMTEEGEIRTDASELLYTLYRERGQQVKAVQSILDKLVKQHELEPVLQDRYVTNREGRWVLPIKSGMQHHFEGIIHSSSHTKQTVFMEPKEIIPVNNRLRQIEVEIEEEIERLLTTLSKYLTTQLSDFNHAKDCLLECDVRMAQAQLTTHLDAEACQFTQNEMRLKNLRHPILALNDPEVVANTVELDPERRLLLLSGPNAGGKTVLLKAVGLAAHMARCGLPICAEEGSSLPFFKEIHVAVGDSQSVDAQLSTFAAHLKILNQATKAKGSEHLLLIDEICGSTDPEEGSALARSFIQSYAESKVFAVITSHLSPLKLGWKSDSGVVNGSLEYDQKTGRPTYQFLMGVAGQSLAIQTARRVGVDSTIIERALKNLSPEMQRYQMGLTEIEDMKEELRLLREQMDQNLREAKKEKSKFMALAQKFDRDKEQMVNQAVRRAEKKIDTMIEHSKVHDVFKRHEKLESTKFELPEIIKASHKNTSASQKIESADDFAKAFPPGSKVFVPRLGRDGVVQARPNQRGEIQILANSMLLTVPWDQLKIPQQAGNPTREVLRRTTDHSTSPLENDRVIDVRGLRLDDAIKKIETQLDHASVQAEERIKIVHGHGTEALKRGIRSYLSRSLYVKKWTSGSNESGGDGITWVEIKD